MGLGNNCWLLYVGGELAAGGKKGVGRVSNETRQLGAPPIHARDLPEKEPEREE